MHTSSSLDHIGEYLETVQPAAGDSVFRYRPAHRPVHVRPVRIRYKTARGMAQREFTVYRTHHGPIVRQQGAQWVSVRLMQEPVKALMQSYLRTKARNLREFEEVLNLHTNSSNNTVFADAD